MENFDTKFNEQTYSNLHLYTLVPKSFNCQFMATLNSNRDGERRSPNVTKIITQLKEDSTVALRNSH